MQRQDIVSGLKNSVERGYSLDLAVQSFVNAGYNKQDVEDSAKVLGYSGGLIFQSGAIQQQVSQQSSSPLQAPQNYPPQQIQPQKLPPRQNIQEISQAIKSPQQALLQYPLSPSPLQQNSQINIPYQGIKKEKSWIARNWIIILLVVVLASLITGLLLSVFYKEGVVDFLKSIGINLSE